MTLTWNGDVTKQPFHIFCSKTVLKFSSVKNKIKTCRKTRPDTAKLLAFLKSAAKNTPNTIYSFMTSKISQTSIIVEQNAYALSVLIQVYPNPKVKSSLFYQYAKENRHWWETTQELRPSRSTALSIEGDYSRIISIR